MRRRSAACSGVSSSIITLGPLAPQMHTQTSGYPDMQNRKSSGEFRSSLASPRLTGSSPSMRVGTYPAQTADNMKDRKPALRVIVSKAAPDELRSSNLVDRKLHSI